MSEVGKMLEQVGLAAFLGILAVGLLVELAATVRRFFVERVGGWL